MSSLTAFGPGSPVWVAEVALISAPAQAMAANDSAAVGSGSSQSEPDSRELAGRAKAGCRDSFEQLVRRHENHIFNFIRQMTRNRQDAEDLTQETFLKAYRSLNRYLPSFAFAPWLFTIARRTAISHYRAPGRFEELNGPEGTDWEDPSVLLERKDERNSLWNLARTLKRKQWEALWLRYGEGFSTAETARVMGTNQIHVKVLLHRARAALAAKLAARGHRSAGPAGRAGNSVRSGGPAK